MINRSMIFYPVAACFVLVSACSFGMAASSPEINDHAINTAAVQTVNAIQTLNTGKKQFSALTLTAAVQKTQPVEDLVLTATLPRLVSLTSTQRPTTTPTVPSLTPLAPTAIPPTAVPCNWAAYTDDVTVPDNTPFYPNLAFIKTWRLKNMGSCPWTPDYEAIFSSGETMSGPNSLQLGRTVNPGGSIDLSIKFTAPVAIGFHTGYWMLRTPVGALFGLGNNQSKQFWVTINVIPLPSININTPLDIAANYCAAVWTNGSGATLTCPAPNESFSTGSIMLNDAPKIEKDYQDNEPALITIPNNGSGGMISGRFPDVVIKTGDHFRALTGCLADSPDCSVDFAIRYSADGGSVQTLSTWTETFDGNWSRPDIDLSFLAGKHIQMTLEVNNSNSSSTNDRAFWMAPKIGP